MMLVPGDEARIYRNFIQGAGPRAIGVGYPGEVNLAWDANDLRPALIWQGDFMDASKHWVGRGSGFQGPAGFNTLNLPRGLSLAILEDEDAPWPSTGGRTPDTRFKGYQLDESRFPAFRYIFHGIEVTDYYEPFEAGDAFVLRRTMTLKGKAVKGLTYLAASGENLQVIEPGGKFRIGDLTVTLTVSKDPRFKLRQGREITVPLDLSDGTLTITQVYDW
jgi:hypothetical protein